TPSAGAGPCDVRRPGTRPDTREAVRAGKPESRAAAFLQEHRFQFALEVLRFFRTPDSDDLAYGLMFEHVAGERSAVGVARLGVIDGMRDVARGEALEPGTLVF